MEASYSLEAVSNEYNCVKSISKHDLQEDQLKIMHSVVNKQHSMEILSTGFGRYLIYCAGGSVLDHSQCM